MTSFFLIIFGSFNLLIIIYPRIFRPTFLNFLVVDSINNVPHLDHSCGEGPTSMTLVAQEPPTLILFPPPLDPGLDPDLEPGLEPDFGRFEFLELGRLPEKKLENLPTKIKNQNI